MAQLTQEQLEKIDAYWRAANYLAVGQIYLQENPLLREPLKPEHIKLRLLGHWGTSPGLSLIYVHLNRLIREADANVIYITGPGHGAPAILANVYLEGTYTEIYPDVTQDETGMRTLEAWSRQDKTLGLEEAIRLLEQVAQGSTEYSVIFLANEGRIFIAVDDLKADLWDAPYMKWAGFSFDELFEK